MICEAEGRVDHTMIGRLSYYTEKQLCIVRKHKVIIGGRYCGMIVVIENSSIITIP